MLDRWERQGLLASRDRKLDWREERRGNGDLSDYLDEEIHHQKRFKSLREPAFITSLITAALVLGLWLYIAVPRPSHPVVQNGFTGSSNNQTEHVEQTEHVAEAATAAQVAWENITPSEKLYWYPCNTNFYCARLILPMDYTRPLNASKNNPKVYIGLMLLPGTHTGTANYSSQPILFNFGGPGTSGVQYFLSLATALQTVVGTGQDILTFDPRGIGTTLPNADCFSYPSATSTNVSSSYFAEDNAFGSYKRTLWTGAGGDDGNIGSSDDALLKNNIRKTTLATLCQQKDTYYGNSSIFRYMHTSVVAQDMLSIVDAWSEYTSRQSGHQTQGQLMYWGLSVGTVLGATFASMFPDRVGRIVLDGVVDADKYSNPVWTNTLGNMDYVINTLPQYCLQAGSQCALYRSGDKVTDIANRFQTVMNNIKAAPVPLITSTTKTPVIINYSEMRDLLFSVTYTPTSSFPPLAVILNGLLAGNASVLESVITVPDNPSPFASELPAYQYQPKEEQLSIMCSDKRYPLNTDLAGIQAWYNQVLNESSFADTWVTLMDGCNTWNNIPIPGPLPVWDDKNSSNFKAIKTANPLFLLSNTYDPVTPLTSAVIMAGRFVNAGLVEVTNAIGHTSLSAVSLCALGLVQEYFQQGTTPPAPSNGKWTECSVDEYPWHPYGASSKMTRSEYERNILALKEAQAAFAKLPILGKRGKFSFERLADI